jgi:hypothetical protein
MSFFKESIAPDGVIYSSQHAADFLFQSLDYAFFQPGNVGLRNSQQVSNLLLCLF